MALDPGQNQLPELNDRLSQDEYFMIMAATTSLRATCSRRKVGAVMVREGRVVSTGYNGSPPGYDHCTGGDCLMHNGSCINTIHAEMNALINANALCDTIYCTDQPCINCYKAILSHNPKMRIVWLREYKDDARLAFIGRHNKSNLVKFDPTLKVYSMIDSILRF